MPEQESRSSKIERIENLIHQLEEYLKNIEEAEKKDPNPNHEPKVPIPLGNRVPFQEAIRPTEGIGEVLEADTPKEDEKKPSDEESKEAETEKSVTQKDESGAQEEEKQDSESSDIPEIIDINFGAPVFAEGQGTNVQEEELPEIDVPEIEVAEDDIPSISVPEESEDLPFVDIPPVQETEMVSSLDDIDDIDSGPPPIPDSVPFAPEPEPEAVAQEQKQTETEAPEPAAQKEPKTEIIVKVDIPTETVKECKTVLEGYRDEIAGDLPVLISFISDDGKKRIYRAKDIATARLFISEEVKKAKEDIDPIDRTREAYIRVGNEDRLFEPTPPELLNEDERFKGEADAAGKLYVYEGDFHSIIYNELTGRTARWDIFNMADAINCDRQEKEEKFVVTDKDRKKYLKSSPQNKKSTIGKLFSTKK